MKKLTHLLLMGLMIGGISSAYASQVLLTTNKSMEVSYRIAHANRGGEPIYGETLTTRISKSLDVPIKLDGYQLAGLSIISVDGHVLPPEINQFNQPRQCSMTTDKQKATGALALELTKKGITCRTYGGVFG